MTNLLLERPLVLTLPILEEHFRVHGPRHYMLALKLCKNTEEAGDLVSEGMIRAWKAMGNYRNESKLSTWIYRIMFNVYLDVIKKKSLKCTSLDDVIRSENSFSVMQQQIASKDGSPFEILFDSYTAINWDGMDGDEISDRLAPAVRNLPHTLRQPLLLYHFEDLDYEEIAQVLKIPCGTVKSRIYRARQRVKDFCLQAA